ncbi:MAG: ATP-dependent DNA helicase RecG [Eubacterium sp.]|nr:ATP-dependent DNA helicase RecG [Eubacterium sp.]
MDITSGITEVKGVGDKTADLFHKLNIYTVRDLITVIPRDYLSYEKPVRITEVKEGVRTAVFAKVSSYVKSEKRGKLLISQMTISDPVGSLQVTFFNSPYIKNVFKPGAEYVFVGTVKIWGGKKVMEMPEYYAVQKYRAMTETMQPIYNLTAGLSNNTFRKCIREVIFLSGKVEDILTEDIRKESGLMPLGEALLNIHFPTNREMLKDSIRRLAFNEFLSFLIEVNKLRSENVARKSSFTLSEGAVIRLEAFLKSLPYSLTKAQSKAIDDIVRDMQGPYVMNRLVQGDVGSGKTIVAAAALYLTVLSGYQGALMVPTEVLAVQHYEDFKKLFDKLNIKTGLLTGSLSVKEKRAVYEKLKTGDIDIVIGTHALIQDKPEYERLGLVVTDEQHRFGVKQREKLSEKGNDPHTLIMSATPIPRTLAIILYADLDISVIDELPSGRKKIMNCVVGTSYRDTAYNFIYKEIEKGHQAYIICPMVEASEGCDAENVVDYSEMLKNHYGGRVRVEYLHGKMPEENKNAILKHFMNREIDVLVSTTVIEVGINNQNATVMMVENAERFGLAQLHQLRGRVGRGDAQSYCIFINTKDTEEALTRLRVLENSNDGFYIANEDLKQRGPGDFFGIRQSGDVIFRVADIYNHHDMLKAAQDTVIKYGDILAERLCELQGRSDIQVVTTL